MTAVLTGAGVTGVLALVYVCIRFHDTNTAIRHITRRESDDA